MKAAAFDYVRPRNLDEAVAALKGAAGEAKIVAGWQSLGPMLNLRLVRPKLIVDVARIESLRRIDDLGASWRIGGAVTHAEIEDAHGLGNREMLRGVAAGIAYRAVRNRGTIGGSLAHADPAADWPLALSACAAVVSIRGPRGERSVPADRFVVAAFTTDLQPDEIVQAVIVPKTASMRTGYYKFFRKTGEFPQASAAVVIDHASKQARIFVGALHGPVQPLSGLASDVAERGPSACTGAAIAEELAAVAPRFDAVQLRMHVAVVQRAVQRALQ
jgi:aerobic carbon-monoxide dehydrogenase medium subunit